MIDYKPQDPGHLNTLLRHLVEHHIGHHSIKLGDRIRTLENFRAEKLKENRIHPKMVHQYVDSKVKPLRDKLNEMGDHRKMKDEDVLNQYGIAPVKDYRGYDLARNEIPKMVEKHVNKPAVVVPEARRYVNKGDN